MPDNEGSVVYKIRCRDCDASYIRKTGRKRKTRLEEHSVETLGKLLIQAETRKTELSSLDFNRTVTLVKETRWTSSLGESEATPRPAKPQVEAYTELAKRAEFRFPAFFDVVLKMHLVREVKCRVQLLLSSRKVRSLNFNNATARTPPALNALPL